MYFSVLRYVAYVLLRYVRMLRHIVQIKKLEFQYSGALSVHQSARMENH